MQPLPAQAEPPPTAPAPTPAPAAASAEDPAQVVQTSAEALLAVTGLFPDMAKPIGKGQAADAAALPGRWLRRVSAWLEAEKWARFRLQPMPAYLATYEKLTAPIGLDEIGRYTATIADQNISDAYKASLSNAREYARANWPVLSMDTATTPRLLEPGKPVVGQATAMLAVLDDPGRVLDELDMGTLTEDQAKAFRTCYPALYEMLRRFFEAEILRRRARVKSFTIPYARELQLRTLLGMPAEMSITEVQRPPPRMTSTGAPRLKIAVEPTKAQRLEAK